MSKRSFVQIAAAGTGEDVTVFALDSDGVVWTLGHESETKDRHARRREAWFPYDNTRVGDPWPEVKS